MLLRCRTVSFNKFVNSKLTCNRCKMPNNSSTAVHLRVATIRILPPLKRIIHRLLLQMQLMTRHQHPNYLCPSLLRQRLQVYRTVSKCSTIPQNHHLQLLKRYLLILPPFNTSKILLLLQSTPIFPPQQIFPGSIPVLSTGQFEMKQHSTKLKPRI